MGRVRVGFEQGAQRGFRRARVTAAGATSAARRRPARRWSGGRGGGGRGGGGGGAGVRTVSVIPHQLPEGAPEVLEVRKRFAVGERAKLVTTFDWDAINANREEWTKRWNREVER